jgi:hypothetical protein
LPGPDALDYHFSESGFAGVVDISPATAGDMHRYTFTISSRPPFAARGDGSSLGTPRWTAAAWPAD